MVLVAIQIRYHHMAYITSKLDSNILSQDSYINTHISLIKNYWCNQTAHCHCKESLVPLVRQQYTRQLLVQCLAGQVQSGALLHEPVPNRENGFIPTVTHLPFV